MVLVYGGFPRKPDRCGRTEADSIYSALHAPQIVSQIIHPCFKGAARACTITPVPARSSTNRLDGCALPAHYPRENNVRSSPRFLFQPLDCSPCRFSLNFQGTVRSFPTSTSLPSGPEMPIRRSLLLRRLTVFKLPSPGSVQRVSPSAKVPDIFRN